MGNCLATSSTGRKHRSNSRSYGHTPKLSGKHGRAYSISQSLSAIDPAFVSTDAKAEKSKYLSDNTKKAVTNADIRASIEATHRSIPSSTGQPLSDQSPPSHPHQQHAISQQSSSAAAGAAPHSPLHKSKSFADATRALRHSASNDAIAASKSRDRKLLRDRQDAEKQLKKKATEEKQGRSLKDSQKFSKSFPATLQRQDSDVGGRSLRDFRYIGQQQPSQSPGHMSMDHSPLSPPDSPHGSTPSHRASALGVMVGGMRSNHSHSILQLLTEINSPSVTNSPDLSPHMSRRASLEPHHIQPTLNLTKETGMRKAKSHTHLSRQTEQQHFAPVAER